jgi:copper(I)-binding protein
MRLHRALALVGCLLAPVLAQAEDAVVAAGNLRIRGVEVAAPMAASRTAAAYLVIENTGAEGDRLIAAESPGARRVELHTTEVTNGVARMVELTDGIDVPAGGAATLARQGMHVMLMGLTAPLDDGAEIELTLVFERAGRIEIAAPVHLGAGMRHGADAGHSGG